MSIGSVVNALFKGMATGKLNPVAIAADIVVTILDGGSAGGQAEKNWEQENLEAKNKLIDDTLIALKKLPTGPQFKNTKPIVEPTKNAPKPKNKPVSQPPTKYPVVPNQVAIPIDPFWIPKELVKRIRAISGTPATEQKYGDMELWPVNYEKTTFNVRLDIIGTQRREENKKTGTENFIKWFARKNGNFSSAMIEDSQLEGGGVITGDNLFDQCCYFTPQTPGDFTGPMAMEFGAAAILDRAADLASTRVNASHGGVRGVLWAYQPTINIVPSGTVDIADRLPNDQFSSSYEEGAAAALKELFEYYGERKIKQLDIINTSHGQIGKHIGVGIEEYAPMSYVVNNRTQEEEIKLIDLVIKNYEDNLKFITNKSEQDYLLREIDRLQKEQKDVSDGKRLKSIKTLADKIDLYADLTSQILGHWPILINFEDGTLITQTIQKDPNFHPLAGDASFEAILKSNDPQNQFKVTSNGEVKVNLPNLSEAIADLTLLLMDARAEQALMKEIIVRLATEACSQKNIAMEVHDHIDAIVDFLGFKVVYQKDWHIIPFNPTITEKSNFADYEFCIGKAIERRKPLFGMDKENQTLITKFHIYDQMAAIVRSSLAQQFTGINKTDVNLASINQEGIKDPKQYLARLAALADDMSLNKSTNPDDKSTYSFRQRLEAIEKLLRTKNADGTFENDGPIIKLGVEPVTLDDGRTLSVGNAFDKKQIWIPGSRKPRKSV